jgi:hypothetical protein
MLIFNFQGLIRQVRGSIVALHIVWEGVGYAATDDLRSPR